MHLRFVLKRRPGQRPPSGRLSESSAPLGQGMTFDPLKSLVKDFSRQQTAVHDQADTENIFGLIGGKIKGCISDVLGSTESSRKLPLSEVISCGLDIVGVVAAQKSLDKRGVD